VSVEKSQGLERNCLRGRKSIRVSSIGIVQELGWIYRQSSGEKNRVEEMGADIVRKTGAVGDLL